MSNLTKQQHKSKIGGQALIEGIMMRGVHKTAMAVRTIDGEIKTKQWDNDTNTVLFKMKKIPFVRGAVSMIESMLIGYRCMMKSVELSGFIQDENEDSGFQGWLEKIFGEHLSKVFFAIGTVLGVALSIGLFMFLPSLAIWGLEKWINIGLYRGLIEGFIKISIFVLYLAMIGKMPDMKRVFEYHGAEHKTIACFEKGEPLLVEHIVKQRRFHPRCGTSFIVLVLIISILVFSVVTWSNPWLRTLIKIVLLPVVVGVAYELIRLAGRYDNLLTRFISFPGLQLQYLTTREPNEQQIEVAIAAMQPVLPENLEEDRW